MARMKGSKVVGGKVIPPQQVRAMRASVIRKDSMETPLGEIGPPLNLEALDNEIHLRETILEGLRMARNLVLSNSGTN